MAQFELTIERTITHRAKIIVEGINEDDANGKFLDAANEECDLSAFDTPQKPIEWEPWDDTYDVIETVETAESEADRLIAREKLS